MNSSTRSQSSRPQAVPLKDHLRHDCPVEDEESIAKRRKDMFGDCALVEIIHLHDCLRGALKALQQDVIDLSSSLQTTGRMSSDVAELERRVAGRFKVIWSVFRAHSAAEDEFIWPALQNKTGRYLGSPKYDPSSNHEDGRPEEKSQPSLIEQEEYEEDHADEERMFRTMDQMLSKLRDGLVNEKDAGDTEEGSVHHTAQAIHEHTSSLMKHLLAHLEKEETRCMPLVMKHLNREE
jgi:iron-sulfur cluster repair protein YtfE (RIC family)